MQFVHLVMLRRGSEWASGGHLAAVQGQTTAYLQQCILMIWNSINHCWFSVVLQKKPPMLFDACFMNPDGGWRAQLDNSTCLNLLLLWWWSNGQGWCVALGLPWNSRDSYPFASTHPEASVSPWICFGQPHIPLFQSCWKQDQWVNHRDKASAWGITKESEFCDYLFYYFFFHFICGNAACRWLQ